MLSELLLIRLAVLKLATDEQQELAIAIINREIKLKTGDPRK